LYDKDGNQRLDFNELEAVLVSLMKNASKEDIEFVMIHIYHLDPRGTLTFEIFAPFFITHIGELGVSKFAKQHSSQRNLNRDEFILLFKVSYHILNVDAISNRLL
jgi:hypothetical protein